MNKIIVLCLLGDPMLTPASIPGTGGFNVDSADLINILNGTPYDVIFITNYSFAGQPEYEKLTSNIELYRIKFEDGSLQDQNLLIKQIDRIMRQIEGVISSFDSVFLLHGLYWLSGYIAARLSAIYQIPFIYTPVSLAYNKIHAEVAPKCRLQEEWEKFFLPKASLILSITDSEKEILTTYYGVDTSKIIVLGRHGASLKSQTFAQPDKESELSAYNEKLNLIHQTWHIKAFTFIGRIVPDKGVIQIIKAWYQLYLADKNIPSLWIIGGSKEEIGTLYDMLETEIPDFTILKKSMRICFWGYLPPDMINVLLLRTLVLIEHSRYEAGGRVILEAFSTGTPVIATPFGFAKDMVQNWQNGFLVEYGDIPLLKDRMSLFVKYPLVSEIMGNSAFEVYQNNKTSWNSSINHQKIYRMFFNHTIPSIKDFTHQKKHSLTNYFRKGMLNRYDDFHNNVICFCKKNHICPDSLKRIPVPDGRSLLWANDKYYIKQIYSVFNHAPIWNKGCNQAILPQKERLEKAQFSSCFPVTTDIAVIDQMLGIYCMPKYCSPAGCIDIWEKAGELVAQFNYNERNYFNIQSNSLRSEEFSDSNPNTLESFWEELISCSELKHIQPGIYKKATAFLTDSHSSQLIYGFNYGKNIIDHVVKDENDIYLLPSSSVFWGETGYDAGQLIYSFAEHEKDFAKIKCYIYTMASFYKISPRRLANWTAFICIKLFVKNKILQMEQEEEQSINLINSLFEQYQSFTNIIKT